MDCIALETGAVAWAERLTGPGANRTTWASPVLANGLLYVTNQSGDTSVVRASPEFALLAVNSIGEACNASLVVSEGEVFLRTHEALWCLGEPLRATTPDLPETRGTHKTR
jgi:hypothetical protein